MPLPTCVTAATAAILTGFTVATRFVLANKDVIVAKIKNIHVPDFVWTTAAGVISLLKHDSAGPPDVLGPLPDIQPELDSLKAKLAGFPHVLEAIVVVETAIRLEQEAAAALAKDKPTEAAPQEPTAE